MKVFNTVGEPDDPLLQEHIELLCGGKKPDFVWVDNVGNFRFWNFFPLYLENNKTFVETAITLKNYHLIIHKKTTVVESVQGDGFSFNGGFSFCRDGFSVTGSEFFLTKDGFFEFDIETDDLKNFDMGIHYYALKYDDFCKRNFLSCSRSPVFKLSGAVKFKVKFSPIFPLESHLSFAENYTFESCFTTIYGESIEMSVTKDFYFVFKNHPQITKLSAYCLTPSGIAEIIKGGKLMPGRAGTEYIKNANEITFLPNNPAFFDDDFKLPDKLETAYLKFSNAQYFSQPQNACYYKKEANSNIYPHTELVPVPIASSVVLPAFPLKYGDFSSDIIDIEDRFIAPKRHGAIENLQLDKLSRLPSQTAVTRHGMKIKIENGVVEWLGLVASKEEPPEIALFKPQNKLLMGLLDSNLFMVLQNKSQLEGQVEKAEFNVELDGWEFLMQPENWEKYQTVVVLKLSNKYSLEELMKDSGMWSFPPLEDGINKAQETVKSIIDFQEDNPNKRLQSILHDKNWCGLVAFNCGVNLSGLPNEIAFLANGIEEENFKAQFLAFPAAVGSEEESVACALLNYSAEEQLQPEDFIEYAFNVLNIRMEIFNKRIVDFSARVELLINRLFGGRVSAHQNEGGNYLVLNGSYQRDEKGYGYYSFVMTEACRYFVSGCVITGITIEQTALHADSRLCRFVLSGQMTFYNTGAFDLFSFDSLPFSNLIIEMTPVGSDYEFNFVSERMSLSIDSCVVRANSFGEKFPVVPTRIYNSAGNPEKGYTKLKINGIPQDDFEDSWYSILWEIQVGDMGGLAAKVIAKIELLTAWDSNVEEKLLNSDGTSDPELPKLFIGIRLGAAGSPDDWGLPLQGVMTLGFDAIELRREQKEEEVRYLFCFRNFGLRILGVRFPFSTNDLFLISDDKRNIGWLGKVE
ncbi:MAG: hypothetical protein LBU89_04300 [Fibromonadaceae bacterium]|jgi:hypothetical protein|nr:hypothetical protein [Fibromonadaceae bacterium]